MKLRDRRDPRRPLTRSMRRSGARARRGRSPTSTTSSPTSTSTAASDASTRCEAGIRKATLAIKFIRCHAGSAFKNKGVQTLLDAVVDFLPSPRRHAPPEGHVDEAARPVTARPTTRPRSPASASSSGPTRTSASSPSSASTRGQLTKGDALYNAARPARTSAAEPHRAACRAHATARKSKAPTPATSCADRRPRRTSPPATPCAAEDR
jgi:hypothetical protein